MGVNKVDLSTGETLIDISNDTVTPETLAEGATAHNAQGEKITGTMKAEGGESGTGGIIDVTELPTTNINENAVYRVTENIQTNITQLYGVVDGQVMTANEYLAMLGVPTIPNIYVVDELSDDLKTSDVVTFSELNIYILRSNGVAYCNAPEAGGILTFGMLSFQEEGYDKGFTDNPYEETEYGVYSTLEAYKEVIKYFIRKNGEWEEISATMSELLQNGCNDVISLSGTYRSEAITVTSKKIDIKSLVKNDKIIPSKVTVDLPDFASFVDNAISKRVRHIPLDWFYYNDGQAVIDIRSYAFAHMTSLESVELPSLHRIESSVFENCTALKSITLPENLQYIYHRAFYNCKSLTYVEIPAKVETIYYEAFAFCNNLTTVLFKGKPYSIDGTAFSSCFNLREVYVPWAKGENDFCDEGILMGAINATIIYNSINAGYTNIVPTTIDKTGAIYNGTGYKEGYGLYVGDAEPEEDSESIVTGYFPVAKTDVIRIKYEGDIDTGFSFVYLYDENFECIGEITIEEPEYASIENDVVTIIISQIGGGHGVKYARCSLFTLDGEASGEKLIITINQAIT